jgi:hypothetical protein
VEELDILRNGFKIQELVAERHAPLPCLYSLHDLFPDMAVFFESRHKKTDDPAGEENGLMCQNVYIDIDSFSLSPWLL